MRVVKKILLGLGIVVALCGGASYRVEAKMPKARVTSVKATKSGKDKIKVTFKYDSKAKKKGIKKYKVRLTKYTYNESKDSWVKSGYSYVKPSAYSKNGKLKKTISLTIKNKKVDDNTVYKVQVLSANKNGTAKTSYTSAKTVGCMHRWVSKSKSEKAITTVHHDAVTDEEWMCMGCGYKGTRAQVAEHILKYSSKCQESQDKIIEEYAKKNSCSVAEATNRMETQNWDEDFWLFFSQWMNDNTEFKWTESTYNAYLEMGCSQSCTTGKKIVVKKAYDEEKVGYKVTKYYQCSKCGKTKK